MEKNFSGGNAEPLRPAETNENGQGEVTYTREWLKKNTSIGKPLGCVFVVIAILGIIGLLTVLLGSGKGSSDNGFLKIGYAGMGLAIFAITAYTIYAFLARRANAAFYGVVLASIYFVSTIIELFFKDFDYRLLLVGACMIYIFAFSKIVKNVIPPSYRKVGKADWAIAAIAAIPVLCIALGAMQVQSGVLDRLKAETELLSVPLAKNERCDGKIIFTVPSGFKTKKMKNSDKDGNETVVYTMAHPANGQCTLFSTYIDSNDSEEDAFSRCLYEMTKDTRTLFHAEEEDTQMTIGDNICLCSVYYMYVPVIDDEQKGIDKEPCRFFMLFDKNTRKAAFLACSGGGDKAQEIAEDLLKSIRFK